MINFSFDTNGFRDSHERLRENVNNIGGSELAEFIAATLRFERFQPEEVFSEDFGWAFYATREGSQYFCTTSVEPVAPVDGGNLEFYANLSIEKQRSFIDRLRGRNKMTQNDVAARVIFESLKNHTDVKNLASPECG